MSEQISDSFAAGWVLTEATADPDTGVISDVRFLGPTSKNGRRYTREAIREGVSKYQGVPIYVGHVGKGSSDRSFTDLIARARNPRVKDGGVHGDVEIIDQGDTGRKLVEVARRAPGLVGLSHEAKGAIEKTRDGPDRVTEISSVEALALVLDPATTSGLHEAEEVVDLLESIEEGTMKKDWRQADLVEAADRLFGGTPLGERGWAKKLRRMREEQEESVEEAAGERHRDVAEADLGRIELDLFV